MIQCRELYNCVRDKLRVSVPAQLPSVAHSKQEGIATEYLVRVSGLSTLYFISVPYFFF